MGATELPLYMWLYGKLWPVFGLGEGWGRILSSFASLLTALLLFFLIEREFGRESALYGAGLFCVMPLEVFFGRTVQPDATALLGLVAGLYFWDISLERGRPLWAWAISAVAISVATGLKLPYFHVFIPLAALTWRRLGRAAFTDGRMWAAGFVASGAVFAWYWHARSGVYVVPTKSGEFWQLLQYGRLPHFTQFLIFSRFVELVTTYGGMVFFLVGAREIFFRRRDVFWAAWLGGVFVHLVALGYYGHSHEYTSLTLVPPAAAVMGEGLRLLLEKVRIRPPEMRRWALAGLSLLIVSVPAHCALRIKHWYNQSNTELFLAGKAASAVSSRGDLFLTDSSAPSVLLYYLDRQGWGIPFKYKGPDEFDLVEKHASKGAKFFACIKRNACEEPNGWLWAKMKENSEPVWDDGTVAVFPLTAGNLNR